MHDGKPVGIICRGFCPSSSSCLAGSVDLEVVLEIAGSSVELTQKEAPKKGQHEKRLQEKGAAQKGLLRGHSHGHRPFTAALEDTKLANTEELHLLFYAKKSKSPPSATRAPEPNGNVRCC
eukprot:1136803-Pelagomonas_calceolata.AAC.8